MGNIYHSQSRNTFNLIVKKTKYGSLSRNVFSQNFDRHSNGVFFAKITKDYFPKKFQASILGSTLNTSLLSILKSKGSGI